MIRRIHYGWVVVAGCFLISFSMIGVTSLGISVFLPTLRAKLALTATQSSLVLSIQGATAIVALKIAGWFYKSHSIRLVNLFFSLFAAAGFGLMAHAESITMLYLSAGITGISLGGSGHVPAAMLANNWFAEKRGTAIGIYNIGAGLSAIGFTPLISWLLKRYSLAAALNATALTVLVCQCAAYVLIRNAPADIGEQPYGFSEATNFCAAKPAPQRIGVTYQEARRLPRYYLLALIIFAVGFTVKPAISHNMIYAVASGYDQLKVAGASVVAGIIGFATKPLYGTLKDKLGTYASNWYIFVMWILGLLSATLVPKGMTMVFAFYIIGNFGNVIGSMSYPFWVTDLFGNLDYSQIFSDMLIFSNIGIILGSAAFGMLADWSGTYLTGYLACAVLTACCMIGTQGLYKTLRLTHRQAINEGG